MDENGINKQKPKGYWTINQCKADALLYRTRKQWRANSSGGYSITWRNGWLQECCQHMTIRHSALLNKNAPADIQILRVKHELEKKIKNN